MANYQAELDNMRALIARVARHQYLVGLAVIFTLLLTNVLMYGILIYQTLNGMPISSFTMYVTLINTLMASMLTFGQDITFIQNQCQYVGEFYRLVDERLEDEGKEEIQVEGTLEIVFDHVDFRYPGSDTYIYKNLNFTIHKGERLAVVGVNGAGKSTLVKLICRMYRADSGEIIINGKNIYDFEYLSYMKAIAAVFQDYRLFNFTIAENISCVEQGDERVINRLIDEVGMRDKIDELPQGIYSRFGKEYDEEGIELSGGQDQKIAIARALYKDASMVILDEPASALDPIAEAEIYKKFNGLVEDKTAIYISHRMSSSVFCDRILVLDGGTVADFDTHESLMRKTDSLYYKLFHSQAENYRL